MKMKAGGGQSSTKQEAKFRSQMEGHWREIKQIRREMRRSQSEIERLKACSRRKLAQIDELLGRD